MKNNVVVEEPGSEVEFLKEKIQSLENELLSAKQQVVRSENKAVQFKELNDSINTFPDIAQRQAELDFSVKLMQHELAMAAQFSKAKAFGDYLPEQIYTMMQSGKEMGMKPIEALQMLYIVNGKIRPYGDKMIAMVTGKGYSIDYLNETPTGVTVRVYNDKGFDKSETVSKDDQIMQKSKAASFSLKNKMRFHGVRMIVSFYLPHLFGSVADEFSSDFIENEKTVSTEKIEKIAQKSLPEVVDEKAEIRNDIMAAIEAATDRDDLKTLMKQHSSIISMDSELLQLIANKKETFE